MLGSLEQFSMLMLAHLLFAPLGDVTHSSLLYYKVCPASQSDIYLLFVVLYSDAWYMKASSCIPEDVISDPS